MWESNVKINVFVMIIISEDCNEIEIKSKKDTARQLF